MKLYTYIIFLFFPIVLYAQQDAVWLLGGAYPDTIYNGFLHPYEMRFVQDSFIVYPTTRKQTAGPQYLSSGAVHSAGGVSAASICDANGNLLLHCNAIGVYNGQGDTLEGGGSLPMDSFEVPLAIAYRSIYILPKPNKPSHYYLIHPYAELVDVDYLGEATQDIFYTKLFVSEIDMEANGGKGKLLPYETILQDTILLASISVTKHANGRDWWVIAPKQNTNSYYKFLIDATGAHQYPIQTIGYANEYDHRTSRGAYFSQDGSTLIVENPRHYRFLDFDRCTGVLSNFREVRGVNYSCPKGLYNLYYVYTVLSSNNRFLYVCDYTHMGTNCNGVDSMKYNRLYQYDLWDIDPALNPLVLMESDANLTSNRHGSINAPFLTPNGLIILNYLYQGDSTTFNIIKEPNQKGLACKPLRIPYGQAHSSWDMSVLPNYSLGPLIGSPCDTITSVSIGTTGVSPLQVYPNPTQDMLHVHCPYTGVTLTLYNALGIEVYRSRITGQDAEVSLAGLGKGVYFLVVKTEDNRIFTEKVRKE